MSEYLSEDNLIKKTFELITEQLILLNIKIEILEGKIDNINYNFKLINYNNNNNYNDNTIEWNSIHLYYTFIIS